MSSSSPYSNPQFIQDIISHCCHQRANPQRILQQYPTPFVENYAPYSQNQLRDLHFNRDCALQWNTFYKNNGRKAYKDRHYILREFVELKQALDDNSNNNNTSTNDADEGDVREGEGEGRTRVRRRRQRCCCLCRSFDGTDAGASCSCRRVLLLDFGCGVGNLCLPMLEEYRDILAVVASDLSHVAIQSLQREISLRQLTQQVYCEQSDLGSDHESNLVANLCLRGVQEIFCRNSKPRTIPTTAETRCRRPEIFSSLVFVLCSVPQNLWNNVILNIVNSLTICSNELFGSSSSSLYLFFRDYCHDDLAMHRFQPHRAVIGGASKKNNNNNNNHGKIDVEVDGDMDDDDVPPPSPPSNKSSTYMRTNGTLSHFFTLKEVEDLFAPYFDILELKIITLQAPVRDLVSVDWQLNERKFIQGKFLLKNEKPKINS